MELGVVDTDRRHGWCGYQLSQEHWPSKTSRQVVSTGARPRDEARHQDQESPNVGERTRHLDQSSTIKHIFKIMSTMNYRFVTGGDGLSIVRDAIVVLVVFTAFGTKFDPGILGSWLRHRKWHGQLVVQIRGTVRKV